MEKLYVPWRSSYATTVRSTDEQTPSSECVFCVQCAQNNDDEHYILKRTSDCVVMLNLYPYNAGHLLIIPRTHVPTFDQLPAEVRAQLMELVSVSCTIVQTVLGAQGVNGGFNLGRAAGAGIPSHLHLHVLPRWIGDTNFLPLLANTKTISFDLKEMHKTLKPHFATLHIQ